MKFLVLFFSFVFSGLIFADDHQDSGPFYAFYHLQVTNPAAVVAAMDQFWASDCGKEYPADVALAQEMFNGAYRSTHFIINTFQNSNDQSKAAEIMRSCPDAITFLQELAASGTTPVMQYMGAAPIDENDWTQDTVFSKFDIIVEPQDQAAYAGAYMKMMKAASKRYRPSLLRFGRYLFWSRQVLTLGLDRSSLNTRTLIYQRTAFNSSCICKIQCCCG